ncbi:hypothetical protein H2198_006257 [Neophaeococcomyces mojaviensis]|uniref:Uncharacterized protein n=1 Tax=Neophaeococcomyces mojaviensis TaxID=3383035 RepID=A0ACC3A404_9EURO|nr:hypothetical protein H2198_006257 [Knufia sp. JES_112]
MLANSKRELLAAIDGPYGEPIDTTAYGTIMLFASDIGIAGVMAVVKEAMDKRRQWKSNTQRLLLIWQVDNQEQYEINEPFMTELLNDDDTRGVLEATVYVTSAQEDVSGTDSWGERAKMVGIPPDQDILPHLDVLLEKYAKHPCRSLVCVSANAQMRDRLSSLCRRDFPGKFDYREMDFQPVPERRLPITHKSLP